MVLTCNVRVLFPEVHFPRQTMNYGALHLRLIGVSAPFLKLKKFPEEIVVPNVSQELYIQFKVELRKTSAKLWPHQRNTAVHTRCVCTMDAFQGRVKPLPLLEVSNSWKIWGRSHFRPSKTKMLSSSADQVALLWKLLILQLEKWPTSGWENRGKAV